MNYAEARQREHDGSWDWTVKNDNRIYRHQPCTNECHHETEEEACRHFYDYSLAQVQEHKDADVQHKCAVCGEWTDTWLGNQQLWLYGFFAYLCPTHRNQDELAQLQPFRGSITLCYS